MSGVWVFKNNGVIQLVENPQAQQEGSEQVRARRPNKVLVYLPTRQAISSYDILERILKSLGWEMYLGSDPNLIQFHRKNSIDLISLPSDFSKFSSVYMYDIVVKNPNVFQVHDM
ncbi:unnamed protein product [Amaranthus hypochondriacus]